LPLAVEFGKKFRTVGFDINAARIDELRAGRDSTLEATRKELKSSKKLHFTNRPEELGSCNVYIVTVPTPIDKFKRPDLEPLIKASQTIGNRVYDAVVISVGHALFKNMGVSGIRALGKKTHLLFDVKYLFPANQTDQRL
jgi:UDP-N-acetyl-D-galactosamine dehydrogenase